MIPHAGYLHTPASAALALGIFEPEKKAPEAIPFDRYALDWLRREVELPIERRTARIARSFSGGRYVSVTKTGRERILELSTRLREELARRRPTIFATIRDLNFSEYTISIVTLSPPARATLQRPHQAALRQGFGAQRS